MDLDRVGGYLGAEVVMITGAGGSIGAELCRQIARVAPRRLILVDHAEENLFRIQRELEDDRHVHPSTLAHPPPPPPPEHILFPLPAQARGRPPRAPFDAPPRARRLQGGRADARGLR